MNDKRLYRSTSQRKVAGVAAGLADYFGADPTLLRILFVILAFCGPGIPLYLLLWMAAPREPESEYDDDRSISLFGIILRGILVVGIGAVLYHELGSDSGQALFLLGLAFGLFFFWRSSRGDSADVEGDQIIYRSRENRKIMGVFGGLADRFGIDPTILRIGGVILLFVGFNIVVPLYFLSAIFLRRGRRVIAL